MIPYIVLDEGITYKLGGTSKNYWSATRINDVGNSTVSSNGDFLGLNIGHGQNISTYRFDLSLGGSFDQTITNALGNNATSGEYSLNNIVSIGIQTYAKADHKWVFGLISIYGVDSNGNKTLLFDGKAADIKEPISGINGLTQLVDANDVYMWNVSPGSNDSKKVNYQSISVLGTGSYKINYKGSINSYDMYSWMKVTMNGVSEDLVNLINYDGFRFKIDTTHESFENKKGLSGECEFRYSSSNSGSRPSKIYLIDENNNITSIESKDVCVIPSNFKGDVIILFEDLTHVSQFKGNETITCSEFRFIVDTTDMDGCIFKMYDLKFISNGNEIIKGA